MSIYDEADDAFERGELDRAREILTPAAVAGDAEAQAILGTYLTLDVHQRPFCEGVDWLRSAATAGHGIAAHNLATILMSGGPGIDPDCEQAMQYLQRARECGFEATVTPELHHDNSQAWVISDTSALPP